MAWLLNPSVQWLCWEAWHPETMAIPFLLTAYLLATRQQWRWYWVALVVALSWKEDIAIAVAVLGIVFARPRRSAAWAWRRWRVGVGWFLVAYGVVMPHFNGGTNQAGIFYGELGDSPSDSCARRSPTPTWCSTGCTTTTPSATPATCWRRSGSSPCWRRRCWPSPSRSSSPTS